MPMALRPWHHGDAGGDRAHRAGDVVGEADDARGFDAGRRLQLVERDDRAGADIDDLALDAEIVEHAFEQARVLLQRVLGDLRGATFFGSVSMKRRRRDIRRGSSGEGCASADERLRRLHARRRERRPAERGRGDRARGVLARERRGRAATLAAGFERRAGRRARFVEPGRARRRADRLPARVEAASRRAANGAANGQRDGSPRRAKPGRGRARHRNPHPPRRRAPAPARRGAAFGGASSSSAPAASGRSRAGRGGERQDGDARQGEGTTISSQRRAAGEDLRGTARTASPRTPPSPVGSGQLVGAGRKEARPAAAIEPASQATRRTRTAPPTAVEPPAPERRRRQGGGAGEAHQLHARSAPIAPGAPSRLWIAVEVAWLRLGSSTDQVSSEGRRADPRHDAEADELGGPPLGKFSHAVGQVIDDREAGRSHGRTSRRPRRRPNTLGARG